LELKITFQWPDEAKSASRGKWAANASEHKRELLYELEDPVALLKKTLPAVVEYVRDGSTLRVALQLEPMKYQMITLMVSGIKCPSTGEPIADQAKYFTEIRTLNRDLDVRLEQISGSQNSVLIGSIVVDGKNLAEQLLREGMGKVMSWTLGLTLEPTKLRAAEIEAKEKRLRIWKDWKEPTGGASGSGELFDAKVMEVINGDALMIKKEKEAPKKIFLASVRPPPRPENLGNERIRPLYDVPYMFEAREFLRKKVIQKKVKVRVDYIQPRTDSFPEKVCCTVTFGSEDVNIAEGLLVRGLGSVVKYRPDDEKRSSAYDMLQMAELKAREAGKGMWNKKGASKEGLRIVDLSSDQSKAKQYSAFLLRTSGTRREGVLEHVYSPSRVKLFIPKENCLLNMIISGINSPKAMEPFGAEGVAFIKERAHQVEVEVVLSSMDKVGNYIGELFYEKGSKNMGFELVKAGFASIRDRESVASQFHTAEAEAKANKLNIWKDWKEPEVDTREENGNDEEAETEEKPAKEEKRERVVVTQVAADLSSFFAQWVDKGTEFEALLTELREELDENAPLPGAYTAKKGDLVVARYSMDNLWYRARVEKMVGTNQVQVLFVDYGNRETVLKKDLGALPSSKYALSAFPAAAKEYQLAFVEVPTDGVEDARLAFEQDGEGRVLGMKVEYRDAATGLECVSLLIDPGEETGPKRELVLGLVADGLLLVGKSRWERRLMKSVGELRTAQETAKKNRVCPIPGHVSG